MAKQKGLAKFAGKIDEQSFYYSKNGGYQSRKINPGMSARVKTAPEYANTRLNNAEFGGAGSCAGAMVSGITSRWRFILDSIATGKLVNRIKAAMLLDDSATWGKRSVATVNMASIQESFNRLSKNQMPEFVISGLSAKAKYDSTNHKIALADGISCTAEYENELMNKGAQILLTKAYLYTVDAPQPIPFENKYAPCSSHIVEIPGFGSDDSLTGTGDAVFLRDDTVVAPIVPQNASGSFGGLLVVVLPIKEVFGKRYVLQELCAAGWYPIESGTVV